MCQSPRLPTATQDEVSEVAFASPLPDVLQDNNGDIISTAALWQRRREQIKALIQHIEYGHLPPRPEVLQIDYLASMPASPGQGRQERIVLRWKAAKEVSMRIAVYVPNGSGPFPTIVREEVRLAPLAAVPFFLDRGYLFVQYLRTDLDPDEPDVVGPAQQAYPDFDWATLAVWAWGAMRVVDYLETRADVDLKRIGVTGHSRGGKAALLAGALDERFSLVAPNASGCGGAAAFRVQGPQAESLEMITRRERFGYWFHPDFRGFAGRESSLPFDQHHVKALVAPRSLICLESWDDRWANPMGTRASSLAARAVFQLLNAEQRQALHFRSGAHDWTPTDWQALHEFCQWQWFEIPPHDSSRFSLEQTRPTEHQHDVR